MFRIEKMKAADAEAAMNIILHVRENMEHKEWYVIDSLEYYSHALEEGNGVGYKAIEETTGALAGVFIATFPGNKNSNLGYDVGLSDDECKKTAVMDTAAVLPEYRGHGLQYRLMQNAEQEIRELGYHYLTATIHPDNRFSLRNVLNQGYRIALTKEKYGGHIRHILIKDL